MVTWVAHVVGSSIPCRRRRRLSTDHFGIESGGSSGVRELLSRRSHHTLEFARQLSERLPLKLADAFARNAELTGNRIERLLLALEAKAKLEEVPFALGQRMERGPNRLPAQEISRLLRRIESIGIREEVSELTVSVFSHTTWFKETDASTAPSASATCCSS